MNRLQFELRYAFGSPPWDGGISPPELMRFLDHNPPGSALDVGCGTGTNLVTMAARGWQVVGMEVSLLAVLRARRKLARAGVRASVLRADVTRPRRLPGIFDLCLDLGCSHALTGWRRAAYVDNLAHWMGPGSTVLVYTFFRPPDDQNNRWLTLEAVLNSFTPVFHVEHIEKGDFRGAPSAWLTLRKNAE